MKKGCIQNILLIIAGISVAFLLAEIFLRTVRPQIFDVHARGMYSQDVEVGYVHTPNFTGEIVHSEFQMIFHTNSFGLRGGELRPRQENTVRILVLGDSQTWGFGVADHETFSVLLEQLLSARYPNVDIQVLNAGVPGYGTVDQLAFLKVKGKTLQPDLVIVQFLSVNDLIENRTPAYEWATIEDGFLAHNYKTNEQRGPTPPVYMRLRRWLKLNNHLARLMFDVGGYVGTRAGILQNVDALWGEDFSQEDAELGINLLVQISETAKEMNADTLLLYSTGQAHVTQKVYTPPKSTMVVVNAAKEANVPWIDSAHWLNQHSENHLYYYPMNGHWTPMGHTAIAELLDETIVELSLLKPYINDKN